MDWISFQPVLVEQKPVSKTLHCWKKSEKDRATTAVEAGKGQQ
jgi:hypothetical protein